MSLPINTIVSQLQALLSTAETYILTIPEIELSRKPAIEKWSKKEISGHLIDSAINNLQRFTQVQFTEKPYQIQRYNQTELVKVNNYQVADTRHLLALWQTLNNQISYIMQQQTETTLAYEIILPDGMKANLKFLMEDYVNHLEHHVKQITA